MKFISDKGLDELKRYQYKSGGYTTIDNLMNGFWFGISERLPLWLAPNLITFLGFLIMVTASACQIYYDTTFTKDIPRWTFWLMAFAIFAYQTLDAVDGKQARRTKSSSPLGQLFDHGCDSFILTFFGLAMAQACKVDKDFFFWIFLNVQLCEWAINQKEHITGILNTNLGNFGVTELEFICIGVEITAAIFGQDLLTKEFFGFVLYKIVFMPILVAAVVANIYMLITNIISSQNRLEAILEWIPIFLHVSCQFAWLHSNIYSQLAAPILLLFGLILSLITCKVIVCSVTKDHFPLFHVELIPFIIFTLLIQFGNFSYDNNIKLFWAAFLIESTLIFIFLRGVILQILQHLNIYLFKIAKL